MVLAFLLGCGVSVAPSGREPVQPVDPPAPEAVADARGARAPELRILGTGRLAGLCEPSAAVLGEPGLWIGEDDGLDYLLTTTRTSGQWSQVKRVQLGLRGEGLVLDDIEGATAVGSEVWWTTSVSRDRPDRAKMVWMDGPSADSSGVVDLMPWRQPGAFEALVRSVSDGCDLPDDLHLRKPKRGGLDIEGLAGFGDALYLGLRGPLSVDGSAVFVRMDRVGARAGRSATELVTGAWCVDLGGRGVRSLTADPRLEGRFLGIAGDAGSGGDFDLFSWSPGTPAQLLGRIPTAEGTSPEALVLEMDGPDWVGHILFDEGARIEKETGCDCATVLAGQCVAQPDLLPDVQVVSFRL